MGFWDRVRDKVTGEETAASKPSSATIPEASSAPESVPSTLIEAEAETAAPEPVAQPQVPASPSRTYTVQLGDTVDGIAKEHGTDASSVIAVNDLQHPDRIYPGQVLQIP